MKTGGIPTKKTIALVLALVLALTMLAGAALAEGGADEHTIDMKEVPVYMGEEDMESPMSLFFLDGA